MSRNSLILAAILASVALAAAPVQPVTEDAQIMRAIVADEAGDYLRSAAYYLDLYDKTGNGSYLIQGAREAILAGGASPAVSRRLEKWLLSHPKDPRRFTAARFLALLTLRAGDVDAAMVLARAWLLKSDNPVDWKLGAQIALKGDEPRLALEFVKKAFAKTHDEAYLVDEAKILSERLNDPDGAIALLENYLRIHPNANVGIYLRLALLYRERGRFDRMLEVYKRLYDRTPQELLFEKIVQLSLYLRDLQGLTRFVEAHAKGHERLLYRLYKELDRYDDAIALARTRYAQTHDPKWLAEEAILLYEKAKSHNALTPEVLRRFRELFDRALAGGVHAPLYLNYYGYTLIDHDLDVKRGIALVRRALGQNPDNPFYLDSLAWGLYKEGKCDAAWRVMQKVFPHADFVKEPEIQHHIRAVRECREQSKKPKR
ncbi:tetratricopeptide repeat protein [Nitratifractor sp.]